MPSGPSEMYWRGPSCLLRCTGGGPSCLPRRTGGGPRSQEVGDGVAYLKLRLCHQNEFCIRMGSGESHFNVSLIVRGKVTKVCP